MNNTIKLLGASLLGAAIVGVAVAATGPATVEKIDNSNIKVTQETQTNYDITELKEKLTNMQNTRDGFAASCAKGIASQDARIADIQDIITKAKGVGVEASVVTP